MESDPSYILGIWDGHDSGAALLRDNQVIAAVNEERFTRRKLEVEFPYRSIESCLAIANAKKEEINTIAVATFDLSKTLSRLFPSLKERHYQVRRRKTYLPWIQLHKRVKFLLTPWGPSWGSRVLSQLIITQQLKKMGFKDFDLFLIDHHEAHAATAAYFSPFEPSTIVTMDGVGDGLSSSVYHYKNGKLERRAANSAFHSLGIFFEQVTYLLNMRELEDEGKVMALASYASKEIDNPLDDFFVVDALSIRARYSPMKMFSKLEELAWKLPWEKLAAMAQQTLEEKLLQFFKNALQETGIPNVAWAGGVGANIKANQKLRRFTGMKRWFVFPHMGDGGLPLGAALCVRALKGNQGRISLPHLYFGPQYSEDYLRKLLELSKLSYSYHENIEQKVANLLAQGNIMLWFQEKMELGPRALGNRSILAPAGNIAAKDDLNMRLKRRSWFQPFCPSILREEAHELIEDYDESSSPFMTMGYQVDPSKKEPLKGVISHDGSLRPQLVEDENPKYRRLLKEYKNLTGDGFLLNTSFNRHGEPLVNTPEQAIEVMQEAHFPYLCLGNFLVKNERTETHQRKER